MKPNRSILLQFSLALGLTLALLTLLAGRAQAVEFDSDGTVGPGEVIEDDLFITAETTQIDGVVNGDVFVNSNHSTINGTINGNLIAFNAVLTVNGEVNGSIVSAGQILEVNGPVQGSIYAAAYSVVIQSKAAVERNLFSASYSLETQPGSSVGRDVLATDYQTLIYGQVGRDLVSSGGALELGGEVGRNVQARVESPSDQPTRIHLPFAERAEVQPVQPGLRVTEAAQIGGKLTYTSSEDQSNAIASVPGDGIVFHAEARPAPTANTAPVDVAFGWGFNRLRDLATLLILGGLIYWQLPGLLNQATEKARLNPLPAAGWGAVSLAAGFVLLLTLAGVILVLGILMGVITLGGLSLTILSGGYATLGLAAVVFFFLITYGSKLVFANLVGRLILDRYAPTLQPYYALGLGVALYVLFSGIPLLGWLVALIATLVGLGAVWLTFKAHRQAVAA